MSRRNVLIGVTPSEPVASPSGRLSGDCFFRDARREAHTSVKREVCRISGKIGASRLHLVDYFAAQMCCLAREMR
jgi:hypothetical protein